MARAYVGIRVADHAHEAFTAPRAPTEQTHGKRYMLVTGPFPSMTDAKAYVKGGYYNNPCGVYSPAWYADEQDMLPTIFSNVLPSCPLCPLGKHTRMTIRRLHHGRLIMYCPSPSCTGKGRNRLVVIH